MGKRIEENQLKLPNGEIITFNDQQYEGIKKILIWLKNNNSNFFTLAGYSGTGKTTILKKIIENYRMGIVVSAPTHKARKVIENTTNKEGKTLHSLLGLRPDVSLDDFNPNDPKFNPIALPKINDYNFIIIDEASMINKELYEMIKEKIKTSKVLFVGDPAQIPPVNEVKSPVFTDDSIPSHWLTKIERQKDTNQLLIVADQIRNNLTKIDSGIKRTTMINDTGDGIIFTINKPEFRKKMIEKYKSPEHKKDVDYTRVIGWRNSTIMKSNKTIRNELYDGSPELIEIGDLLMGYRTVTTPKYKIIIENSADYNIIEKEYIEKNNYDLSGWAVTLKEQLPRNRIRKQDVFIVDTTKFDNLHNYADLQDMLRFCAVKDKKKWKQYYEFRMNNLIMTTIDKYRNGFYRDDFDVIGKDLDYGYAITCHKAQGSTYKHVFIMEDDINCNDKIVERNQIKYVAVTRPIHTATILTTKLQ